MPAGEGCASNGTSRGRSRLPRMCQPSSPGDLCRTKQTTSGWRPDHLRFEVRGSEKTGDLYMKDETHFSDGPRAVWPPQFGRYQIGSASCRESVCQYVWI